MRHALEKRLHAWGARVTCLSCMREAVLWLQDGTRPDLLLADQRLGDGTGLEAMALMREHWPDLPTVIVTGDTAPAQLQSLYGCGAPILHKPFKIDDLRETLQHACQGESNRGPRPTIGAINNITWGSPWPHPWLLQAAALVRAPPP